MAMLLALAVPAKAKEVTADHQGLDVIGEVALPKGKTLKDGAALILHDTLGHAQSDDVADLQAGLTDAGIPSLAITLSLGLNARRGAFDCSLEQDHRHSDAIAELGTWIDWLKAQGAANVTLVGLGRGAAQITDYAAQAPDKIVRRLALVTPLAATAQTMAEDYETSYGQPAGPTVAQALALVDQDESASLVDVPGFLGCARPRVTAGAFADYYKGDPEQDTALLLSKVKLPVLVINAAATSAGAALAEAAATLPKSVTVQPAEGGDPAAIAVAAAKRIATFAAGKAAPPSN